MNAKIGIPRSLFYYKFMPFWEVFFTELGNVVVVSGPTNKQILDNGVKACIDEACLPIKVFFGHVIDLMNRVDYILVPRFTSISRGEYICPEFGGLPDMIRHSLKGLPALIDTEVNMRVSERGGLAAAIETGVLLGAGRRTAVAAYKSAVAKMKQQCCSFTHSPAQRLRVAVIGHPYNVYDRYVSMDLLGKLEKYGADAITIEMVDVKDINSQAGRLKKPMFWNYGRNAYGAAMHLAGSGTVDGFICITSFGCGIDSFVNDLIERRIRREYTIPFITMTIDEHSGEAGFNTRLEAFIDMLRWRKSHENNISASGKHLHYC
ncbi:MAG: acyl-CoA dehydratase activase-related protein [Acetivibrionales bacterium]